MSDETSSHDDGFDNRIRSSMAGLGAGAAQTLHPSSGADIRHRAGRRRQALAVGTLTAAMILGGGAVVASDVLDRPEAGFVLVPAETPSTPPPATPGPTTEPTELPSPAPAPDAPTPTTPPASETPQGASPPTEIPAGFTLPHEGEKSDQLETTDWQTVDELTAPWDMSVCGVNLYEGDEARSDFRAVSHSGPEIYDSHALAVYEDADVAAGVMAAMRTAIEGCVDQPVVDGQSLSWDVRAVDAGGEAFVAVSAVTDAAGSPVIGGEHYAVARLGTAVYLISMGGESFPSVDDDLSEMLAEQLREFVPRLCVFTVAGC